MIGSPIHNALFFLISTFFNLYLFVLIIRLICFYTGMTAVSPLTQLVSKLTSHLVLRLKRFVPDYKSLETATLVAIILVDMIKILLLGLLQNTIPVFPSILMITFYDCIYLIIETFFYAILIQGVLSFIQPAHPFAWSLNRFTAPVVSPFRRFVPVVGVLDLAPFAALLALQLLLILCVYPMINATSRIILS